MIENAFFCVPQDSNGRDAFTKRFPCCPSVGIATLRLLIAKRILRHPTAICVFTNACVSKTSRSTLAMHFYYARELLANGRFAQARETFERFLQRSDAFLENRTEACLDLIECAEKPGENPLPPLLRSLGYDVPQAEACCEIGNRFLLQNQMQPAIFWYETALQAPKKTKNGGFIRPDAYDYVPCLQLCVAYYRIGDIDRSIEFNERAAQAKPTDASVVQNRPFFESLKKRELSE